MLLPLVVSAAVRGLWAPDEPRYAQVAREVFERGSLLVMHLCGELYPDKPPLLFWTSGLFGWLSGWSELAMRLPSLAATAVTAWLVARLARRWWGEAEAGWTAAVYLTFAMVTEIGGRLQIDPLLTVLCVGALVALLEPAATSAARGRWALVAGLLMGLGALAKGPVAYVNVLLVVVAWRLVGRRDAPRIPGWAWAGATALVVGPVVGWAVAAALAEPRLVEALFFDQHLGRITKADRHPGPVWKHLTRLPLLLLPWTLVVVSGLAAAAGAWRRRDRSRPADRGLVLAGMWFAVLVVFYSLIPPKRDLYLLPAYPAAALVAGRQVAEAIRRRALAGWVGWATAVILGVAGIAVAVAGQLVDVLPGLEWRAVVAGGPLAIAAVLAGRAVFRARPGSWAGAVLLGWASFSLMLAVVVFPPLDDLKSAEDLARYLAGRPERPTGIPCHGRLQAEGYRFYGEVPAVRDGDLVGYLVLDGSDFLGLANEAQFDELPEETRELFRVVRRQQVGGKPVLVLVAARPRPGAGENASAQDPGLRLEPGVDEKDDGDHPDHR